MIVLHGIWNTNESGRLHLWAETSNLATTDSRHSTKLAGAQKPRLHPFALMRDDLVETVGELLGGLHLQDAETDTLTMRLPSTTKGPSPSPELVLSQPRDTKQEAEFRWWYMVTAALDAGTALDFLLALPDRPPMGIAFGSDLRFWVEAARFCLELLTRQCFVPTLHEVVQGRTRACRANWEIFCRRRTKNGCNGSRVRCRRSAGHLCRLKRELCRFCRRVCSTFSIRAQMHLCA